MRVGVSSLILAVCVYFWNFLFPSLSSSSSHPGLFGVCVCRLVGNLCVFLLRLQLLLLSFLLIVKIGPPSRFSSYFLFCIYPSKREGKGHFCLHPPLSFVSPNFFPPHLLCSIVKSNISRNFASFLILPFLNTQSHQSTIPSSSFQIATDFHSESFL